MSLFIGCLKSPRETYPWPSPILSADLQRLVETKRSRAPTSVNSGSYDTTTHRVSIVYRFPRRKSPFIAVSCQMDNFRKNTQLSQAVLFRQLTTKNGRPAQRFRLPPPPPNSQGRQMATIPVYPSLLLRFQWFHSTGRLQQPATFPDTFCRKYASIYASTEHPPKYSAYSAVAAKDWCPCKPCQSASCRSDA